jgi:hypothetical protein
MKQGTTGGLTMLLVPAARAIADERRYQPRTIESRKLSGCVVEAAPLSVNKLSIAENNSPLRIGLETEPSKRAERNRTRPRTIARQRPNPKA